MNAPKVVVRRGDAVDEYPLPLPFVPTYREMNLIKRVTDLSVLQILGGAGSDPDADFAVAIYAMKRERPDFSQADAEALFDLPFGGIEIHFDDPEPEVPGADPLPPDGVEPSEPSSENDKQES